MDRVTKTSAESRVESASVPSYEEKKNIREKKTQFSNFPHNSQKSRLSSEFERKQ